MTRMLSVLAVVALAGSAQAGDHYFYETDFNAGSWNAMTPFWSSSPDDGESLFVATDRFIGGNPPNNFMLSQFTVDIPQATFNVAHAPIMLDAFHYDPSADGAITEIAASMTTLQVATGQHDHYGGPRMYIEQGGSLYMTRGSGNFTGFNFDDADQVRNFSGYTEQDFVEIIPDTEIVLDSHPDFAGGNMRFGFGLQLTSTYLNGEGPLTIVGGYDSVSVRFSTVPAPGALALLGGGALCAIRRRRA